MRKPRAGLCAVSGPGCTDAALDSKYVHFGLEQAMRVKGNKDQEVGVDTVGLYAKERPCYYGSDTALPAKLYQKYSNSGSPRRGPTVYREPTVCSTFKRRLQGKWVPWMWEKERAG